ncbi:MAG: hypothetical protein M1833_002707 [Piccolia ochrophora]|nr:MAG: hypothetical protein M1833_002707 [Piccolia ochrophora]
MPRSRSRSRSPTRDDSRREHSPRRRSPRGNADERERPHTDDRDRPRRKDGGFRWKEKTRRTDDDNRTEDRRLERGYRQRQRSKSPVAQKEAAPQRPEKPKTDKPKKAAAPSVPGEPMIIVNVNDRLGTKAAIPCLASDSVGLFKAQVAAQIGRQPHEILLKRQGERPFKDALTLEDYGVSNGVQLDLELDTGD